MTVSRRLRFEILNRDNHTCRYCHATDTPLTIDHVIPTALGGTDDPDNLVAACKDCNAGKSSSHPDAATVAQVADDAVCWGRAMQQAADTMRADLAAEREFGDSLDREWSRWTVGPEQRPIPRPDGWRNSVAAWRLAGCPIDIVVDSATRALGNDRIAADATWRYFCGIVWNRVTELQKVARADVAGYGDDAGCQGHPKCDCEALAYEEGRKVGEDFALDTWRNSLGYVQSLALVNVIDADALLELNLVHA